MGGCKWMDRQMDKCMDVPMQGRMDGHTGESSRGWTEGLLDRQTHTGMDRQVHGSVRPWMDG